MKNFCYFLFIITVINFKKNAARNLRVLAGEDIVDCPQPFPPETHESFSKYVDFSNLEIKSAARNLRVLAGEDIVDCPQPFPPETHESFSKYVDFSNLEIVRTSEDVTQFKGEIKFLKNFDQRVPWQIQAKTQFHSRGQWTSAPMQFKFMDLCPKFDQKDDVWYNVTKHFNSAGCPPKAGTIYPVDETDFHVVLQNVPNTIPVGNWRAIMTIMQVPNRNKFCFMMTSEVIEV